MPLHISNGTWHAWDACIRIAYQWWGRWRWRTAHEWRNFRRGRLFIQCPETMPWCMWDWMLFQSWWRFKTVERRSKIQTKIRGRFHFSLGWILMDLGTPPPFGFWVPRSVLPGQKFANGQNGVKIWPEMARFRFCKWPTKWPAFCPLFCPKKVQFGAKNCLGNV